MESPLFYTLGISPTLSKEVSSSIYKNQIRDKNFAFKKKKNHEFPPGLQHHVLYREKWGLLSGAVALGWVSKSGHTKFCCFFFFFKVLSWVSSSTCKVQSHPQSLNWYFPWGPRLQLHLIFQYLNLFKFKASTYSPGIRAALPLSTFPQPLSSSLILERVPVPQQDQFTLHISLCSLLLEQALGVENWPRSDNKAWGQDCWKLWFELRKLLWGQCAPTLTRLHST